MKAESRRLIIPEVVQTSAMDCGPAALKCLLAGFGISVSYGRLREACQTDVDGTSIDTLEELAVQFGLDAEQIMLPADHLPLSAARALPAIVVVRLPNGATHFVVAWRRHGPLVQLMDPSTGRRWTTIDGFLDQLFVHRFPVPAANWRDWAGSDDFTVPLHQRLTALGLDHPSSERLCENALRAPGWQDLATLDAATRLTAAIVGSGGLERGTSAARVLERFWEQQRQTADADTPVIPPNFWSVRPLPAEEDDEEEQLLLRGAVLVRVRGRITADHPTEKPDAAEPAPSPPPLSPELAAALEEPPNRPWRELLHQLRGDGLLTPVAITAAGLVAAGGVLVEALLFRGLIDLGRELGLAEQRLGFAGLLLLFTAGMLLLDLPIATAVLRLGRRLEGGLRLRFLGKIPRIGDRYFHSRPSSDMAERGHNVHRLRQLPMLGEQFLRVSCELLLTTAGIIWLDPASAPAALLVAILVLGLPLAAQSLLAERELRVRTHIGALGRFYLDALLGLVAVRSHQAERAVKGEHQELLGEWARAGLGLQRAIVAVEGVQAFAGFGLAAWLLLAHLGRESEPGGMLLLVYWTLNLPMLGEQLAQLARQYPRHRNVALRVMEPLGALEEEIATSAGADTAPVESPPPSSGPSIALKDVTVVAAGHTILADISLQMAAGAQIAIVGHSGAGKSSLVGLLLGWHRPAAGQILVDGSPLDGAHLARLRRATAWVDPAVHLWNSSLLHNLRYGTPDAAVLDLGQVIEAAELRDVLEKLPEGLQTVLGEAGGSMAGGEGQRVRLARGLLRPDARLVILDEPFRGLDRPRRRQLLNRARQLWQDKTLLCITHDVGETRDFDRVLVLENGQLVEDDTPQILAARPDSRYSAMLAAEQQVREKLWSQSTWQRLWLDRARLTPGEETT